MHEWKSPSADAGPYGIAIAPDGRVWYNESRSGLMVMFDPASAKMATLSIPTPGCVVRNIAVDAARGRIWLALSGTGRIGKIELR